MAPYVWYPQRAGRAELAAGLAATLGRDRDPVVRQALARLESIVRTAEWTSRRAQAARVLGRPPGAEGSLGKLHGSLIAKTSADVHALVAGAHAMLDGPTSLLDGVIAEVLVSVPAVSIAGGTDEIQRNIIGERILGLPKEPQVDRDLPYRESAATPDLVKFRRRRTPKLHEMAMASARLSAMTALDLAAATSMSFDCYGTLADWETGILAALRPWAARNGITPSDDELLAAYSRSEPTHQTSRPALRYREVLRRVHGDIARELGVRAERRRRGCVRRGVRRLAGVRRRPRRAPRAAAARQADHPVERRPVDVLRPHRAAARRRVRRGDHGRGRRRVQAGRSPLRTPLRDDRRMGSRPRAATSTSPSRCATTSSRPTGSASHRCGSIVGRALPAGRRAPCAVDATPDLIVHSLSELVEHRRRQ